MSHPPLFLAPMEGVGDRAFRRAMSVIGGFDHITTEFIRVPRNAHTASLCKAYDPNEVAPFPLTAQLMGDDPQLMAEMAQRIEARGAPRIDLNCGCPSNTVVGRGAGSSLLRTPDHLFTVVRALCDAVSIPVSVKMRSGFGSIAHFRENLFAIQEAGAVFITLHPRTKREAYRPPAHWSLIAAAVELLDIPVVGNGDIKEAADALRMLKQTKCWGVMIGRAAIGNPWIFHQVRALLDLPHEPATVAGHLNFLRRYAEEIVHLKPKSQINKCKQLVQYTFQGEERLQLLRSAPDTPELMMQSIMNRLR